MKMTRYLSASSDVLPLVFTLIAVAVLLYLCYLLSRFIGKKANRITSSNNIRILERVALSQDKGLVIAEICGSYYLIGFSNERVEILKELDASMIHGKSKTSEEPNFFNVLNSVLKGRQDLTEHNRGHKNGKS